MSVCRRCSTTIKLIRVNPDLRTIAVEPIPDRAGEIVARKVKPARYGMHPYFVGHWISSAPADALTDDPRNNWQRYKLHRPECERIKPPDKPPPQAAPQPLF